MKEGGEVVSPAALSTPSAILESRGSRWGAQCGSEEKQD